jgi:hypothetical protein
MIQQQTPAAALDLTATVGEAQTRLHNMEEPIDRVSAFLNAMSHMIETLGPGKDHNTLMALNTACEVVIEDLEEHRRQALAHLHPLRGDR